MCVHRHMWPCTELISVLSTFSPSIILAAFQRVVNSHSHLETSPGSFHPPRILGCHGDVCLRGTMLQRDPPALLELRQVPKLPSWRARDATQASQGPFPAGHISLRRGLHHQSQRMSLLARLPQIPSRSTINRFNVGKPAVGAFDSEVD